jgi:crotonobetaine/carnitine-CoA ligase
MLEPGSAETNDIAALLAWRAQRSPHEVFLKLREGDVSYGKLLRGTLCLAAGLARTGVGPGCHVGVMLPNCLDFVQLIFAVAHLGAVLVPINTAYRGPLLHHALETADVDTLVIDERYLDQLIGQYEELSRLRQLAVRAHAAPSGLLRPTLVLSELYARSEQSGVQHHPDSVQAILFTSGTTGPSKGVIVPHALALESARTFLSLIAHEQSETIYCPLPLFHASGMWEGLLAPLLAQSPVALVERFSVSRFWADVRGFDARIAMGVFSMVPILLNQTPLTNDRDHRLRAYYTGKSLHDAEFSERFNVRCVENYASTEAGIPIAAAYGQWAAGSCGKPWSETHEVAIVDAYDRVLPAGQAGEIVVRPRRPFTVTPGYYNHPAATASAFRNLWFHTGDLAWRDSDGHYYMLDRIKDCIRRRGENISAYEVELGVNRHPAVLESAAIAVPSELEEDEVKVVVVTHPGMELDPEDLVRHCCTSLPAFMVPRYVEIVGELPRNTVGKIAKHELRSQGEQGITTSTWERPDARRLNPGTDQRVCQQHRPTRNKENAA